MALRIERLPETALEAAEAFREHHLHSARKYLAEGKDLAIVVPPASFDHADWRRAMAHDLARAHAPARVNIVAGDDEASIAAALAFLEQAPGVTGQYLPLHGAGRFDG
uniref:Rossmann fold domain-containing protein n=1 Tax=Parerythrobacter lutipelagi TaxID=1964208 RepID=UPI0010F9CF01|nr:hypothetical protein [Parerythrobacter lutipelagi]